jgi:hypothetical protein
MGRKRKFHPFHTLISEGYEKKLIVRNGGRSRKATRLEVVILQQVLRAVEGNKKAIRYVIDLLKEDAGIRRPRGFTEYHFEDSVERHYHGGMTRITYPDGRTEWINKKPGADEQPISAPTKAQIRRWEEED